MRSLNKSPKTIGCLFIILALVVGFILNFLGRGHMDSGTRKIKVMTPQMLKNEAPMSGITLEWEPNPTPTATPEPGSEFVSYQLHWGTESGVYQWKQDVGNVTTATVAGLGDLSEYFFAVRAVNANQFESGFSNEIMLLPQATPSIPPGITPTPSATSTATATSTPTAAPFVGNLVNISTRAFVQGGENALIAGFVIQGGTRKVIIRAIGPSLLPHFERAIPDPFLELRNGFGSLIDENDNWRDDQETEIIATGIPPANDLESAIVRTLAPGSYTAIVSGVNNGTGVALVEVYAIENP